MYCLFLLRCLTSIIPDYLSKKLQQQNKLQICGASTTAAAEIVLLQCHCQKQMTAVLSSLSHFVTVVASCAGVSATAAAGTGERLDTALATRCSVSLPVLEGMAGLDVSASERMASSLAMHSLMRCIDTDMSEATVLAGPVTVNISIRRWIDKVTSKSFSFSAKPLAVDTVAGSSQSCVS